MKEGIPISQTQRGVPKINRQEQTSSVVDAKGGSARRDEMANAKEFDARNVETDRPRGRTPCIRPGPCLTPTCTVPPPCQIPRPNPKCGPNR